MKLRILQIDAFTKTAYGGNPCAVVLDADGLTESQMQTIALEMNLSETAFVMKSDIADVRARYFTPTAEIPLAGHPTIATAFALIMEGRLEVPAGGKTFRLQLQAGVISVQVAADADGLNLITMSQNKPEFLRIYDPDDVAPTFGLGASDLLEAPVQTVSTGTPQLMIPLRSLDCLRRAAVDRSHYSRLFESGDFFSPHLFVTQGLTESGDTFARHFGPPPLAFEDPFTGSATGGMACYLWRYGMISDAGFVAQQGHWMGRPGEAYVEIVGSKEDIDTVKVGGYAREVMQGEIVVPE